MGSKQSKEQRLAEFRVRAYNTKVNIQVERARLENASKRARSEAKASLRADNESTAARAVTRLLTLKRKQDAVERMESKVTDMELRVAGMDTQESLVVLAQDMNTMAAEWCSVENMVQLDAITNDHIAFERALHGRDGKLTRLLGDGGVGETVAVEEEVQMVLSKLRAEIAIETASSMPVVPTARSTPAVANKQEVLDEDANLEARLKQITGS